MAYAVRLCIVAYTSKAYTWPGHGQRLQVSLQRQIVDGEWVDSSTQPMKHKTRINETCDTMHACASAHVYVCAPMNKCGCAMLTSPISDGFVDAWYLGPGVYGPH